MKTYVVNVWHYYEYSEGGEVFADINKVTLSKFDNESEATDFARAIKEKINVYNTFVEIEIEKH